MTEGPRHRSVTPGPQATQRQRADRHGHGLRRAGRAHRLGSGSRHHPRRRLGGQRRARLRRHAPRRHRRHGPSHGRGGPSQAAQPHPGRHAVDELPPLAGRGGPQRGHPGPGRRPGREARGWTGPARSGRGHRPGRDPGHGPPRPDPPVRAGHGRFPGAGQERRRRERPARRGQGARLRPAASGSSSRACPTWWAPRSPRRSTSRPSASGPDRPATARSWSFTTCSGWGSGSRPSSCASTPTSAASPPRPSPPSPPTCGAGASRATRRRYHAPDPGLGEPCLIGRLDGWSQQTLLLTARSPGEQPGPEGGTPPMRPYEVMAIFEATTEPSLHPERARPRPRGHPHAPGEPRRDRPLGEAHLRLRGEPQARGLLRRGGVHRRNPRRWPRSTAC